MPIMHGIGTSRCCALKRDQRWMLYVLPYWEPAGMLEAGWELKRPCPHYSKPFLRQGHVVCCTGRFRALFSPGPDRALLLPAGGGIVVGRAEATPIRSDRDLAALYYLFRFRWGCVASCGGVCLCVYGEEWEAAARRSEEEEEIGLPPCSKVLPRTAYRPVVPLQLLACVERQAARAFKAEPGSAYSSLLLRTATTALLRGPPPGRTAPFIVSSDGDQIHLILDRSGSEGKKAPPRTARPRPCAVCDWRDSSAASAS